MRISLFLLFVFTLACKPTSTSSDTNQVDSFTKEEAQNSTPEAYTIYPIEHATAVVEIEDLTLYVDPVGGIEKFEDYDKADLVLITHGHGDHLSLKTIQNIKKSETLFIVPKTVATEMPSELEDKIIVMGNGESKKIFEINIDAIAMYNIREEALKFHPKGSGNGYVLTLNNEKVYFSGDTEGTPEMKSLKDIDKAFVCMNMPYTMPVDKAAEAVIAFKPKEVYPYHYRGKGGFSDTEEFKRLVNEGNQDIEVILWDWYPSAE